MPEESKGKIEKKNDEDLEKVSGGFFYAYTHGYVNMPERVGEEKGEFFDFTDEEKQALTDAGYTFELSKYYPLIKPIITGVIDKSGNKVTPEQIIEFLKKAGC